MSDINIATAIGKIAVKAKKDPAGAVIDALDVLTSMAKNAQKIASANIDKTLDDAFIVSEYAKRFKLAEKEVKTVLMAGQSRDLGNKQMFKMLSRTEELLATELTNRGSTELSGINPANTYEAFKELIEKFQKRQGKEKYKDFAEMMGIDEEEALRILSSDIAGFAKLKFDDKPGGYNSSVKKIAALRKEKIKNEFEGELRKEKELLKVINEKNINAVQTVKNSKNKTEVISTKYGDVFSEITNADETVYQNALKTYGMVPEAAVNAAAVLEEVLPRIIRIDKTLSEFITGSFIQSAIKNALAAYFPEYEKILNQLKKEVG